MSRTPASTRICAPSGVSATNSDAKSSCSQSWPLRAVQLDLREHVAVDRLRVADVDDERGPDERPDVDRLDPAGAVDEVVGRIDVRAGVDAAAELAHVRVGAVRDRGVEPPREGR